MPFEYLDIFYSILKNSVTRLQERQQNFFFSTTCKKGARKTQRVKGRNQEWK